MNSVSDDDFDQAVLERSRDVPVLVDFWAPWCGPCRVLGPILERISDEMAGELEAVKLNVDENPIAAARFRIQGIPAVKLFKGGEVIGEFVGALPEARVRAFLEEHVPSQAAVQAALAGERLAAGDAEGARAAALAALAAGTSAAADLVLARLALGARDFDGAMAHAQNIPASAGEWDTAQAIAAAAELGREAVAAGDPAALRARIAREPPGEMADAFALAVHRFLDGDAAAALEDLLALVARDRRWRDEAARRAMLTIFSLIGTRSPLADQYRKQLSLLL
ncbi:MAG TPA: thioredoxin [Kofleriaceae bacterium]|nr:thioredoxin [Kofleriaceae bacterium]